MDLAAAKLTDIVSELESRLTDEAMNSTDPEDRERFFRIHAASRALRGSPPTAPRGATINCEASRTGIRLTCQGMEDAYVPSWAMELLQSLIPLVTSTMGSTGSEEVEE